MIAASATNRKSQARAGITLIEMLLVMLIFVMLGALAFPSIGRSFSGQKLSRAADVVRSQLNNARVQSMRTGEIHALFYMIESSQFKVAPFNEEAAKILSKSFQSRGSEFVPGVGGDFGGSRLPRGIVFFDGESMVDARAQAAISSDDVDVDRNFRPILFYPDGTSQTARLYLRSDDDMFAEIRLRGMTGTSTSSLVDPQR